MIGAMLRPRTFVLALAALALIGACSSQTVPQAEPTAEPSEAARPAPPAAITITPADGQAAAAPADGISVEVAGGQLTSVEVLDGEGEPVDGTLADGDAAWSTDDVLAFETVYKITVSATNPDGEPTTRLATVTTAKPDKMIHTAIVPLNGETVGVGLPIPVQLSAPVENKAKVERNLVVESSPATEGSWHWIADDKLRYRPKEYWQPGTEVTVQVRLQGIDAGNGVYGDEERDVSFTVGRAVRSLVDLDALTMTTYIDGEAARTVPVTGGKPGWETRNGIKVALETHRVKTMDAATVGIDPSDPEYYRLDVQYAIRVTWSGEFVHGAEWSTAAQGRARVSHGCVGMSLENAAWFFEQTIRGDIIEVVNSPTDRRMELDNGFGDWNMDWEDWVAGSALSG